jgi:hypothetical protein
LKDSSVHFLAVDYGASHFAVSDIYSLLNRRTDITGSL